MGVTSKSKTKTMRCGDDLIGLAVDGETKKGEVMMDGSAENLVEIISNGIFTVCSRLGFSGLMGFAAGYAIKQAAKVAVTVCGAIFLGLQGLGHFGYITVNVSTLLSKLSDCFLVNDSGRRSRRMRLQPLIEMVKARSVSK